MQQIVIDQPYQFVPPRVNRLWQTLIRLWLPRALRRQFGLVGIETVGGERLRSSLDAGHGVLVASNHSRNADPLVLGWGVDRETGGKPAFMMGGWHLFMQHPVQRYLLPRVGAFSVYREGPDRESLKCAVGILARGDGPLSMFPEGYVSHCTERLAPLTDGVAFIARVAAKQRRAEGRAGRIMIQPTFIRYFFDGDLEQAVDPVLGEIEERLTWQNQAHLPMVERIERMGEALLAQRELEHLGATGSGDPGKRVETLIDHMLGTLEKEWPVNRGARLPMERVRRLRGAILSGMVDGSDMPESERARRWHQLGTLYQVQNLTCRPDRYLDGDPSPERILDMIDRIEEDLTDKVRPHPPCRAVIFFGEALEAGTGTRRRGQEDPITAQLRERLEQLQQESLDWRKQGGRT